MKYLKKRRWRTQAEFGDNDPLTGVANLFDIGLVFIVGLLVAFFSAYNLLDLFDEKSDLTIMKKSADGSLEIITKEGKQVKSMRVGKGQAEGRGERLGTAYRLEDGTMIYVPE